MNPIEAARDLLPWWVVWGPLLFLLPAVFLTTLLVGELAAALALWSFRRNRPAEVLEQSRLGYPARWMVGRALLFVPFFWLFAVGMSLGPLCPMPRPLVALLCSLVSSVAVGITSYRIGTVVRRRRLLVARWLREWLFAWVNSLGGVILILITISMPKQFGPLTWALLGVAFVSLFVFALGSGVLLLKALGVLKPAGARLQSLVERVAPPGSRPVVYEADLIQANAFAFPLLGRMMFTNALLDALPDDQIEAIAAHELAHLSEPPRARIARLLLALSPLPVVLLIPVLYTDGLFAGLLLLLPSLIVLAFANRLSRSLERRADASAASLVPSQTYAQALLGLHRANLAPLVFWGAGVSHPHLYDRLIAAGMQPEFPRPAPPPSLALRVGLVLYVLLPLAGLLAGYLGVRFTPPNESAIRTVLAVQGGSEVPMSNLGVLRSREAKWEEAATLFRASTEIAPSSIHAPASLVLILAHLGECDEAEAALREAEARARDRRKDETTERLLTQAREAINSCRVRRIRE